MHLYFFTVKCIKMDLDENNVKLKFGAGFSLGKNSFLKNDNRNCIFHIGYYLSKFKS